MARVTHFEFNVKDIEKTIEFYKVVFNWNITKWEGPIDYWLVMTGDENTPGIDGGIGSAEEDFPNIVNIMDVKNIDEVIEKIKANGGEIIRPKHAVPGVGWLTYFKDPEGIVSGVMEEDLEAK